MTRPRIFLLRMLIFLVCVAAVVGALSDALIAAFNANPLLNTLIVAVMLIGIGWTIRQVTRLGAEVNWVEAFRRGTGGGGGRVAALPTPRLLAPMANMLTARAGKGRDGQERFTISAAAMRSLLDTIASRLDESRELSRYMTGLLIFLGLLGTFWGLLLTVRSVGDVIGGMQVGSGDINVMFGQLKSGLAQPLRGMGTAFSSSMLGLAGALVLGFLDLTAGQAQNRFFNELEEWLAGLTRLSSGVLGAEGEGSVPAYLQALLEQTAENMENLQRFLVRGEDDRREAAQATMQLTERIAALSDTLRAEQQVLLRIAESHQALTPALLRLTDRRGDGGFDDATRAHLRNIELYLQRLLTESEQGRQQATADVRNEIKILTRTIAALAEEQPR
jgi:hypothetical protein